MLGAAPLLASPARWVRAGQYSPVDNQFRVVDRVGKSTHSEIMTDNPNYFLVDLSRRFIQKWFELMLKEINEDLAELNGVELWDQLVLRAKWEKTIELLGACHSATEKYKTPAGEFELIAQYYGDQLGLPAQSFPSDIKARLDWYKRRIASQYERTVKADVNKHQSTSPIEQIFLMEWRFLQVDENSA
jgi:hypothetical protein